MHNRFAREAVKSVALNSFRLQFPGNGKYPRDRRQSGVKGGVKTRYLRKPRKMLLCEADDRQSRWNMQRREGGRRFELRQDRIVNEAMLPEFWAAMDNSMSDCGWRRHFEVDEKPSDTDDRFPLAGYGSRLGEQRGSA